MRPQTAKPILTILLLLSAPVAAQEGGVIDVFEGQSNMKTTAITVESTDGAPVIDGGDDAFGADASTASLDGGFTLRFERTGTTILVPAKVEGRDVYFLFDTGASYTSLTGAFAQRAGIMPGENNPAMTLQSANGVMQSRLGIIDSLILGGRSHSGVTFGVCDGCPTGSYKGKPIVGLLGMNVIGRYRTSFDHSKGVIEMSPSDGYSDRWRDIEPWLKVRFNRTTLAKDGRGWVLHGSVKNRSPRRIRQMTLRHWCKGGTVSESSKSVAARKEEKFEVLIKDGDCNAGFNGEVVNARW